MRIITPNLSRKRSARPGMLQELLWLSLEGLKRAMAKMSIIQTEDQKITEKRTLRLKQNRLTEVTLEQNLPGRKNPVVKSASSNVSPPRQL